MSEISIRSELAEDGPAIERLLTEAFAGSAEARLVHRLRHNGGLILPRVASAGDKIVGYIAFSEVSIGGRSWTPPHLALAPVAVLPEFQGQGIGSQLIRGGLDLARQAGHGVVIVLGHAEYYPQFGFLSASQWGIQCPFPVDDSHFLALELIPGALGDCRGLVSYRPEFQDLE